ncbi:MAG: YtxH domain-containing protein [Nitriliruptoraceae bacterium]
MDDVVAPRLPEGDRVSGPHGWRRIVFGLLVGAVVGAAIGLVLPRDDGPRRAAPQG